MRGFVVGWGTLVVDAVRVQFPGVEVVVKVVLQDFAVDPLGQFGSRIGKQVSTRRSRLRSSQSALAQYISGAPSLPNQ